MKLDKIQIVSIVFSIVSGIASVFYFKQAEKLNLESRIIDDRMEFTRNEMSMIIEKMNELHSYMRLIEQLSPELQKRNSKIKVVKDIVDQSIKNTKENYFKSEREFNDYVLSVVEYSEKYRISVSLILAISRAESNFNPRAVSPSHAQGIMQMLPSTTQTCQLALNKQDHDAFYVRDATVCGVWYLRQLKNIFKEDQDLIIKSYNAGPTYVLNFNGQNLPEETVNYHQKVLMYQDYYKQKIYWER